MDPFLVPGQVQNRTITFFFFFSKVLERLVVSRLYPTPYGYVSDNQYDFVKDRLIFVCLCRDIGAMGCVYFAAEAVEN